MYGQIFRHVLLPAFEWAKGRHSLKYWQQFEESQWLTEPQLAARQLKDLQMLLRYAANHCPYYANTWRERWLNTSRVANLDDFHAWPVIDRRTIHAHRKEMRSTEAMPLISKATGGSSGQPLHFDLNLDSNDRRTALMWRGYGWAGGAPGSKQLFIWGGPLSNVPQWKRWKMGLHARIERRPVINCFEFTPENMRQHVETLNRRQPEVIVSYTTPLYDFARFLKDEKLVPFSPKSLIVGAEKLHDFQRELIEDVFRAPVFETYGSREFMLIGAECPEHRGLHLSQENLLVEILDDDGLPTLAGQEGNVVVTDLFNYGMPFIRYATGDRAVAGWTVCPCGRGLPLLRQVTGRRTDTIRTADGRSLPGTFFPHLLKEFSAVRRFQVVQESLDELDLKLVAPSMTTAELEQLRHAIEAATGPAVRLNIQRLRDIPLTDAGKQRVVVSKVSAASLSLPATSTTSMNTSDQKEPESNHVAR